MFAITLLVAAQLAVLARMAAKAITPQTKWGRSSSHLAQWVAGRITSLMWKALFRFIPYVADRGRTTIPLWGEHYAVLAYNEFRRYGEEGCVWTITLPDTWMIQWTTAGPEMDCWINELRVTHLGRLKLEWLVVGGTEPAYDPKLAYYRS